jgi:hypothetical protein
VLQLHVFAYLTVNADNFAALITSVGEDALVTFGAVRIIFFDEISEDITNTDAEHILKTHPPVASQAVITVMATKSLKI